jgi:hypothetical protein
MGITLLDVTIGNLADPQQTATVDCIVDSGAIFAIVPADVLHGLGIHADRSEDFRLADGTHVRRHMGDARFDVAGQHGASPVIFGEPGDATVIGAVTLESLGLMLDPLRRVLKPLPMLLV